MSLQKYSSDGTSGQGKVTYVVSLDLDKFFDMIPHHVLISKLERYGFEGCTAK